MWKIAKIILVNCVVFLLLILLVEVVLQILPPFNRLVTYYEAGATRRNKGPNKVFTYKGTNVGKISEFEVEVRTNALGFHDRDYAFPKESGFHRVLVLGDSQVESFQVPLDKTFHKLLEERLLLEGNKFEVIALGKSGYGPKEALELYKTIGAKYDPDLVVWSFTDINDIKDSNPQWKTVVLEKKTKNIKRIPAFLKPSKIASWLYTRKWKSADPTKVEDSPYLTGKYATLNQIKKLDNIVYLKEWPPFFQESWDLFEAHFLALVREIGGGQSDFFVVSTSGIFRPYLEKAYPNLEWDFEKPNRLMKELAVSQKVPFLSVKPLFSRYMNETQKKVVHKYDGHLNQQGHRILADFLYPEILKYIEK